MFFLSSFMCFSSTKSEDKRVEQVLPGGEGSVGEVVQVMYTHVSKCKNDTC
jgi:hypothetical protein